MAVRDGEAFLAEAVRSVLAQTYEDLELVVVDDGSTDRTPVILDDFASRDMRVRPTRQPPGGLAKALNLACSHARGRYFARLDADDVALPERLALQVSFLEEHPDVAVVGGSGILIDDDGNAFGLAEYPREDAAVAHQLKTGRVPLMHSAAMIRASAFRASSGYRPVMEVAQDYDLWLRLVTYGRITNLREPVIRYRMHEKQVSTRDIRKTATAVVVARAAAQARARGDPDPLDGIDSLSSLSLVDLGIGSHELAEQEVDCGLWLARTLSKAGYHERAAPLWSLCAARAAATEHPRADRARVMRARADALIWQGKKLQAVALKMRAGVIGRIPTIGSRR
jgi:hypothetical protein